MQRRDRPIEEAPTDRGYHGSFASADGPRLDWSTSRERLVRFAYPASMWRVLGLVAVKVLPVDKIAADPTALDRFYREARAVAALSHPNVVQAFDIDKFDTVHFLVMEYVDGSSLQDIIARYSGAVYAFALTCPHQNEGDAALLMYDSGRQFRLRI